MATREIVTGIYTRTVTAFQPGENWNDFKAAIIAHNGRFDLARRLDRLEAFARLAISDINAFLHAKASPALRAEAKRDAEHLLFDVEELRSLTKGKFSKKTAERLICAGIDVGQRVERLSVRRLENHVATVRSTTAKLRASNTTHSPEKIQAAMELYDLTLRENPRIGRVAAQRRVSRSTGISVRSLQRHLAARHG